MFFCNPLNTITQIIRTVWHVPLVSVTINRVPLYYMYFRRSLVKRLDFVCFKPATHLAILYADRRDRRKSASVPGAAIAIFPDRRDRRICQISAIKFAGNRSSPRIVSKINQSGWAILSHDFSKWRIAAGLGAWEQG